MYTQKRMLVESAPAILVAIGTALARVYVADAALVLYSQLEPGFL